jgi:hypothetical protein
LAASPEDGPSVHLPGNAIVAILKFMFFRFPVKIVAAGIFDEKRLWIERSKSDSIGGRNEDPRR